MESGLVENHNNEIVKKFPLWRKRPHTYLVQASRLDPLKFPLVPSSLPNRRFCNRNLLGVILSMSRKYKFGDSSELYFISFAVINWIDLFIRKEYKEIVWWSQVSNATN